MLSFFYPASLFYHGDPHNAFSSIIRCWARCRRRSRSSRVASSCCRRTSAKSCNWLIWASNAPMALRQARRAALAAAMRPRYVRASAVRLHVEGQERDHVTPTLLPAGAIEALALCDAPLPVRLSLPPCSSHARGEPVATVRALPACAARCFCRHAADSAHSPWPEPCTFLRLCVALLRSEGMHRRLQDPVSMREEGVHRTF